MNTKTIAFLIFIFNFSIILAQEGLNTKPEGGNVYSKEIKTGKYEKTIIYISDKIEEDTKSSNVVRSGTYTESTSPKGYNDKIKPKSGLYKTTANNEKSSRHKNLQKLANKKKSTSQDKSIKKDKPTSAPELSVNSASSKAPDKLLYKKSQYPKHLIILIDRSGSMKKTKGFREDLLQVFKRKLPNYIKDQLYFTNDDYISYVSFGFYEDSPNVNNYIEITDIDGRVPHYGFTFKKNLSQINLITNYFQGMSESGLDSFFRKNFSGVTFAEEMAISYVGESSNLVSETYIITLTDGEFNAMNATHEISNLKNNFNVKNLDKVSNTIDSLSKYYTLTQIETVKIGEKIKMRISKLDSKLEDNFNINRLVNFRDVADKIEFFETPNGYSFSNKIEILNDNKALKIKNIYVNLFNTAGDILATQNFENPSDIITVDFKAREFEKADELNKIIFDFDVHLEDGIYNSSIYSSRDLMGDSKKNFSKVTICTPAKVNKIFGFIPMPKFLYKVSNSIVDGNYNVNVLFWNILFTVVLACIIFIFFIRYVKHNKVDKDSSKVEIK